MSADESAPLLILGHPVAGGSWEGFVIETLIATAPEGTRACFYRSSGGAEADLVLDLPGSERWAIEVERSLTPKPERGFHHACVDLEPAQRFVVYPGAESYPIANGVEVVNVRELGRRLAEGERSAEAATRARDMPIARSSFVVSRRRRRSRCTSRPRRSLRSGRRRSCTDRRRRPAGGRRRPS